MHLHEDIYANDVLGAQVTKSRKKNKTSVLENSSLLPAYFLFIFFHRYSYMPQDNNHRPHAEEVYSFMPQLLSSRCTHTHHDKMFWEARHEAHQDPATALTRPLAVCLSSKSLHGRCHHHNPPSVPPHLDNKDTYVQMLFIEFISAFNTIIPQHLIERLSLLCLNTSLCNWILDFLTGRPQSVRIGNSFSSTTTLSTGAPQGCVLIPLLFTLLTHNCAAMHSSNHIVKFADDMTVVGLISKNDESAYREVVQRLTAWCKANSLSLNVDKKKEMVVDFRRAQSDHSPLFIDGFPVQIIKRTKFLGVHLAENFTWSLNTTSSTKKSHQRLYFLRRLRKAHLPPPILTMFYRGTIESVLSSCITAWFGNCTVSDRKTLQQIVKTAEKIIGVSRPSITDMYTTRCIRKANSIVDDPKHPSHTLHPHAVWKEIPKHSGPHNQTV
ncbi:hypothetical protein QTP86_009718 [Hemibagrus guttatus]|nr:hypothetical protein QTP86_009718 [Hemibagrus guttatus]